MNITKLAFQLIDEHSKVWLSEKLGINRATLDQRLTNENWKKLEIQGILLLSRDKLKSYKIINFR